MRSAATPSLVGRSQASREKLPAGALLSQEQVTFLEGLVQPPAPRPFEDLSIDDRRFLAGIEKRWQARELELPVLSQAAIRLTSLLRAEGIPMAQYVDLVGSDPALTVEVLGSANSAMFAAGQPVTSVVDAIRRIGLSRLGALLIMAQLKKKVLNAASVAHQAGLLVDLAPQVGIVATRLARSADGDQHVAFMRGSLLHVEHMVILGTVADVSREHREPVRPSVTALLQACGQFGTGIRQAVATAWNLEHVLLGAEHEGDLVAEYCGFRAAVLSRWLGQPLPLIPGIEPARLMAAVAHVPLRIATPATV